MKTRIKTAGRIFITLVVILVAAGLRYIAIDNLPVDYDEDDYLRAGQQFANGIRAGDWGVFLRENYRPEHPPLSKIVYGLALLTVPEFPEVKDAPVSAGPSTSLPEEPLKAARGASAIVNMIAVTLLAVINPIAGFFLGIHTFTIKYVSQVMLESVPVLTSLLVVFFYLQFQKRRHKNYSWLVLSAFALGLTAAAKYYYAIAGVAVAAHWLWTSRPEAGQRSVSQVWKWLRVPLLWGILSLVFFFLADPYLWPDPWGRLSDSILFHGDYAQSDQVQNARFPWWQPFNWLAMSVPWHPGVFIISMDILITLFGFLGIKRASQKYPVYLLWLALGLGFLLVWPTKWPQYILMIMAPLSLIAAEGFKQFILEPLGQLWGRLWQRQKSSREPWTARTFRTVTPWLAPGLIALTLITIFPLIFQLAISMTDFQSAAIKDGITGGVWREVWQGITGQVEPVEVQPFDGTRSTKVHYGGLSLLVNILFGAGDFFVFELIWTVLAVITQTALGVAVAMLLVRKGVFLKGFWRTLFILPWAVPEFVAALAWSQIFDARFGFLTLAAKPWAEQAPAITNFAASWQENPNFALIVLLITALWYGFPFMLLSAWAGFKMIPAEVYDAAAMDGASGLKLFANITWPLIFPLLVPAIIIRSIFAFNQFYLFTVYQTPVITLSAISYYVFSEGGYAVSAAINVVTVVILIGLVAWFNRLSKAGEGVTYA